MQHPEGHGEGAWEERRVERLGGPLIAAASAAGIGLSVVRLEGRDARVLYITDVGVEILGHPREVILSRPATSFLTPDEQRARLAEIPPVRQGPASPRTFETTVVAADGRKVPIEVSIAEIEMEGQPLLVSFFRDISVRRRALDALAQSEERFRRLIELAPDAVWIVVGGRLAFVNPASVRLLGYDTAEEVLALKPSDFIHPDEVGPMRERTQQMLATGQPLPAREYRVRRRDGAWVTTEVQSMPLPWGEGRADADADAILGIARDITFRREMEVELVRRERLAALGTLLAGIAHEMNNPLAFAMLGVEHALHSLEAMGSGSGLDVAVMLRPILDDVRHGIERVAGVVRQLRTSARPEVERRGPVDLREVVQSAIRVVHNEIRHRARLHTELAEVPPVEGNAQRLEQVFLNLLVNATQALPEGRSGNEITVALRPGADDQAVVEVTDNGVGIPAEELPRIFDPFFTTKGVGVGMGLGLSICHGIVTAHGGSISVDGRPGHTTFRVILPVRPGAVTAAPATAPPAAPEVVKAGRKRVLVVDDEPALGEIIRRCMEPGCEVDVATDARHALRRLTAAGAPPYDLVLCDLMMPEMTGMELHAVVSQQRPGLERRFVFMTGGAFTPRAAQFLSEVKNQCLEKPFDMNRLLELLESGN